MEEHRISSTERIVDQPTGEMNGNTSLRNQSEPSKLQDMSHSHFQTALGSSLETALGATGNGARPDHETDPPATHPEHHEAAIDTQQVDTTQLARLPPMPSSFVPTERQRFSRGPSLHEKDLLSTYTAAERQLPSREVTDETLDDAYVAFILYCNPSVPLSVDTSELRRGLRSPPKSDGKSFSTYALFELIRKLENKELKSWSRLAILLGVEPPVPEKNQSTQKVQQYAVRLKRWMHAMHVDAFFAYLIEKPHHYYTKIPTFQDPSSESGRDGVPPEEDLALRALLPESRPKRGRRKAEDKEAESDWALSPVKRPRLDTSLTPADFESLFPGPLVPSAHENGEVDRYVKPFDPWAAASAGPLHTNLSAHSPLNRSASALPGGQQHRWRLNNWRINTQDNTPATPYPHSALNPTSTHLPDAGFLEPMSAITPGSSGKKARSRRRHGPAVSSAWPSTGNPLTGKFRGRPPANRSVRDGPFSTFPAKPPESREAPTMDLRRSPSAPSPLASRGENENRTQLTNFIQQLPLGAPQRQPPGRKTGLQLQVPERTGGAVHLATPTFMLNGKSTHQSASITNHSDEGESDTEVYLTSHRQPDRCLASSMERLLKCLTARILKAGYVDGTSPLDLDLAKQLAEKSIETLRSSYDSSTDEEEFGAVCALWFGLAEDLDIHLGTKSIMSDLQVRTSNKELNFDGIGSAEGRNGNASSALHTQDYLLSWKMSMGPLSGSFSLPVSISGKPSDLAAKKDILDGSPGEAEWRKKYYSLQKEHEEELTRIRRSMVQALF